MAITIDDLYRKAHVLMENEGGRRDVFEVFRERIESELANGTPGNAVPTVRVLQSYIKGDSFMFLNTDLPNFFTLRNKKGEIKEDALGFLKEITDSGLIKQLYMTVRDADKKFDLLFLMARYLVDIKGLRLRHYTDLLLMTFHTLLFPDRLEGSDKDRFDVGDLCLRVLVKYDCAKSAERFIRDTRLTEALKQASKKAPSEQYVAMLREAVRKTAISEKFDEEVFALLALSDMLFYVLNEEHNGLVFRLFVENKERLTSFFAARLNELLQKKENEKKALLNIIHGLLDEKAAEKKKEGPTQIPSELLYQARPIET
ncbi:MAG: hypothetical protein EPN22_06070 [Nitrospirae bacterium]|nr:MAG: hypothetical protein EPN22_06070 [Nitrospirota bacterium]